MARDRSYLEGTTYREVSQARSYQELLEKLYDFGLKRSPNLPRQASKELLVDALAELICCLMEATRDIHEKNPRKTELECAHEVLRELRQPDPQARIHKKSGFRNRLKQHVLKEIGSLSSAPLDKAIPLTELVAQGEPEDEDLVPGLGDLPEEMLEGMRSSLKRAWDQVLERVLKKIKHHSSVFKRRRSIVEIFAERAGEEAGYGIVSTHFEKILRENKPSLIIAELRRRGVVGLRGRNKVADEQLRKDIRLVKAALLDELDLIRKEEQALRERMALLWTGRQIKSIVELASRQGREPPPPE